MFVCCRAHRSESRSSFFSFIFVFRFHFFLPRSPLAHRSSSQGTRQAGLFSARAGPMTTGAVAVFPVGRGRAERRPLAAGKSDGRGASAAVLKKMNSEKPVGFVLEHRPFRATRSQELERSGIKCVRGAVHVFRDLRSSRFDPGAASGTSGGVSPRAERAILISRNETKRSSFMGQLWHGECEGFRGFLWAHSPCQSWPCP